MNMAEIIVLFLQGGATQPPSPPLTVGGNDNDDEPVVVDDEDEDEKTVIWMAALTKAREFQIHRVCKSTFAFSLQSLHLLCLSTYCALLLHSRGSVGRSMACLNTCTCTHALSRPILDRLGVACLNTT